MIFRSDNWEDTEYLADQLTRIATYFDVGESQYYLNECAVHMNGLYEYCLELEAELSKKLFYEELMKLKDGVPCDHKGCLQHVKQPCDGCGRNAGRQRKPARLDFSLIVNCPNCGEEIDLADGVHEGMYVMPVFNNKWDDLKSEIVICDDCDTEFQLGGVEL